MNLVQAGYSRDERIVELVEKCGALSTGQVAVWLFGDMRAGYRKAQERLQKLARKRLERIRSAIHLPYIYFVGRQLEQIDHRVALNWVLVWLERTKPSWERTVDWEYEPDYGYIRPDLLWVAENMVTGRYRAVYVELDRSIRNRWDKVAKYNDLFERESYAGSWWVDKAERFPRILVATTTEARVRQIQRTIERDNRHDLRFDVRLLCELKKEVWPWV